MQSQVLEWGRNIISKRTNIDQSNGVFVDFSDGVQGELQSAWVTSFGGNGGSVGFSINNFEKIELTDFADYVVVTEDVGKGVAETEGAYYFLQINQEC